MPKAVDAKTKSGHKTGTETNPKGFFSSRRQNGIHFVGLLFSQASKHRKPILYAVGVIAALSLLLAGSILYTPARAQLHIEGKTISLDIAKTASAQEQGLGGRKSMANNRGMLFVFAQPVATCFWMKGMQFPLDIVWLNSAKQVVYMQQHVPAKSYPKQYCPSGPAKYVIELNAGQAEALGITVGKTLNI